MIKEDRYIGQIIKFTDEKCEICGNNEFEVTELIPLCDTIPVGGHKEKCTNCGNIIEIGLE